MYSNLKKFPILAEKWGAILSFYFPFHFRLVCLFHSFSIPDKQRMSTITVILGWQPVQLVSAFLHCLLSLFYTTNGKFMWAKESKKWGSSSNLNATCMHSNSFGYAYLLLPINQAVLIFKSTHVGSASMMWLQMEPNKREELETGGTWAYKRFLKKSITLKTK